MGPTGIALTVVAVLAALFAVAFISTLALCKTGKEEEEGAGVEETQREEKPE